MTPEYDPPITTLWPDSRNLSPRNQVMVDKLYATLNNGTGRIQL